MAIPMQIALATPMMETCCSVRGMENTNDMRAVITWKTTENGHDVSIRTNCSAYCIGLLVQWLWSDNVLRILLPVRTWKPIRKTLLRISMIAVASPARRLPPVSCRAISTMSRTSENTISLDEIPLFFSIVSQLTRMLHAVLP